MEGVGKELNFCPLLCFVPMGLPSNTRANPDASKSNGEQNWTANTAQRQRVRRKRDAIREVITLPATRTNGMRSSVTENRKCVWIEINSGGT